MTNRSQTLKHAIAESVETAGAPAPGAEPATKKRRREPTAAFYLSWGGHDAHFYFREAATAIGFKAQAIEPQAIALGRRGLAFWDEKEHWLDKLRRRRPEMAALYEHMELSGSSPARARPSGGPQVRVIKNPEKITDRHMDAVRNLRRIEGGIKRLRAEAPSTYVDLELAFCPPFRDTGPKTNTELGLLVGLVLRSGPLVDAYEQTAAKAKPKDRETIEGWLERRLRIRDALLNQEATDLVLEDGKATLSNVLERAKEEAEQTAIAAIRAYEALATPPKKVAEAMQEAEERQKGTPKAPSRPKPRRRRVRAPVVDVIYDPKFEPQE